jgi:hypothetical protein
MRLAQTLAVLAALASVACAHELPSSTTTVTAARYTEPERVLLVAPDEVAAPAPRLQESRTIGEPAAYDLGAARPAAQKPDGARPLTTFTSPLITTRPRPAVMRTSSCHARGPGAATGGAHPAVAGNWPTARSFGPRTMR